ncbi:metallothionein [Salicibibacter halophilus]|uniref:Metallothionein n=1 Tax=Salicibibacter halophilus TaxID=2502791 RepID=A0A514LHV1_9BACI|nr:metallothionein [Salicibibacter halophilus]QDI91409.1 metallothionein [Salicibibacter halophilus]
MEKCARPNCNCLAGENKTIVEGKVYCCEHCANHCTDETRTCEPCDCEKAG